MLAAGAMCVLLPVVSPAGEAKKDEWRTRENLVTRLSSKWHMVHVLTRELSSVGDIIGDMRDMELFPPEALR